MSCHNSREEWHCILIGFCAGAILLMGIGGCIMHDMRIDAVKRGYAEWELHDNGNTTWKWKE